MKSVIPFVTCLVSSGALAQAPTWEKWEHDNSIAHHGSYLVIDQPEEPFCYIKQSHYGNTNLMELVRVKGDTRLTIPFLNGVEGDITYWVDAGKKHSVKPDGFGVKLQDSVFNEMKAGQVLYVQVKPTDSSQRTQEFRLDGFTAAVSALEDPKCKD